jgi:nucleotide-binding universal stress UspA family protein
MEPEQAGESDAWGSAEEEGSTSEGFAMKLMDARTRVAVRNILMAVDFSPSSNGALAYATALAHRYGSRIYLAHVIRPDVYQLVSPEAMETVLEQTRHYAEQQMAKILVSGRLRGIPHQVLLGQGELWTIFSKLIDEHEIDVVVVGTQGRTGLEKMLIGSVAERVFRLAPCPVLTVGPRAPGEVPADAELQRVLYATDFSAEAGCAAAYAFSLAQEQQAALMLLHVTDRARESAPAETPPVLERLKALVPPGADLWCAPRYEVEFGSAADGILKAAGEYKADLIVMGVRHPDFSFSHLPPATAYKVVCRAPCPVLTVRG